MADPPLPSPAPGPPAGPLVLRGAGTVGVQTEEMAVAAVRLEALESDLRRLGRSASAVPGIIGAGLPLVPVLLEPDAASRADSLAEEMAHRAGSIAERTGRLRRSLRDAATGYAEAEDAARAAMERATEAGASIVGRNAGPVLVGLFGVALGAWLAWALAPGSDADKSLRLAVWMREHPRLVTTPEFVNVVRCIAGAVDDAVLGAAQTVDPGRLLSRGGSGVELGGDVVLAAGAAAGLFQESPVRVERVGSAVTTVPPTGIADRLRRVPESDQVRIERYTAPGRPTRWIVYVDPTETFSPKPSTEPWDLTSNVDGVTGHSAGALRATEAAMRDAGVAEGDPVAFVGFSEGGLIAGMLAGSGHWNAQGLETFGGPIGNIPLPDDLAGINVRHTDDFVPALAGPDLPSQRLLVEQRAFAGELPTNEPAPAHQRDSYDRTAAAIDASEAPAVREQLSAMHRFAADQASRPGATSESFLYHAERIPDWHRAVDEPRVDRPFTSGAG